MPDDASPDTETLEHALTEARRAFDKRGESVESIEEKALDTVRTATVLVGLAVTVFGVTTRDAVSPISSVTGVYVALGLLSFSYTVVKGVQTYWDSETTVGVPLDRRHASGLDSRRVYLEELLESYERRQTTYDAVNRHTASHLARTLIGLLLGVGWYTLAGISFTLSQYFAVPAVVSLLAVPLGILVAVHTRF